MIEGRLVLAQFFDDIRQEMGNKLSLIGCYVGGEMVFQKIPGALPELFTFVTAITPKDKPFEKLNIRATINGELMAEMCVAPEQLSPNAHAPSSNPDASRLMATVVMSFAPFVVSKQCTLKIEAETEEGTFHAGSLFIREATVETSIQ